MIWRGKRIETLEDLVPPNPKMVFVGINPSCVSVEKGHYHQGNLGRRFWQRLQTYGIMDSRAKGNEDDQLFLSGFGITDLVKRPTPNSKKLEDEDYVEGCEALRRKLRKWNPKFVCFIYKKAAKRFLEMRLRNRTGLLDDDMIGETKVFLMPSPFAPKEEESRIMRELKTLIEANHKKL